MLRQLRRLLLVLPLAMAGFADGPLTVTAKVAEPHPVLKVDTSLVLIPVHVTTAAGASVTTLTKADFRLTEDKVERPITYFAQDDAPVSVGLLFDQSASMRDKIRKSAEAAASFFKTANAGDEFFLIKFSDRAKVSVPFTPDCDELYRKIASTRPFGRTSLLDAIHLAVTQMKKARNQRKAIVIISDGGDNWSRHTVREVRNALLESDIQLYAIGIFDADYWHKSAPEERGGPRLLDELAEQTGGRHYPVRNLNDLPGISGRIGDELRNEYVLGYYAPGMVRDGKYHEVRLDVSAPESQPDLRTTYRRGYYAVAQ